MQRIPKQVCLVKVDRVQDVKNPYKAIHRSVVNGLPVGPHYWITEKNGVLMGIRAESPVFERHLPSEISVKMVGRYSAVSCTSRRR